MKKVILILILVLGFMLRFYQLGKNPPSLYWDEASLGYNAYTIATSQKDEHGEFLPLDRFIAFGDYKPPGYIYATAPSIIAFGLNEFSVRLPSMIAGFLFVLITYFLTYELFKNKNISFLASFFVSVSPWSIHFSRAAFEANLAAFFNLTAIYFLILSKRIKWTYLLAVIFFIFSFYTFNANRIVAPLLLTVLSLLMFKHVIKNFKWVLVSFLIGLILILPSFSYLKNRESRLRFQEVSIFNKLTPVEISNNRISRENNSLLARVIHNRRILYSKDFLVHFFDNFSLRFLFTHGDVNPRLNSQEMGQLNVFILPFLIIGFILLLQKKRYLFALIISWMLISAIPAGTAKETPHALRTLSILPTYQITAAFGIFEFLKWLKNRNLILRQFLFSVFCFLFLINIFYYLHNYYIHYPKKWSGQWQYGYKQMVDYVNSVKDNYDAIFVTKALGRPYIFFAFWGKYDVDKFLSVRKANRDWYGFWQVESLGNISFNFDDKDTAKGKVLFVSTKDEFPTEYRFLKAIKNLQGEDVFWIGER